MTVERVAFFYPNSPAGPSPPMIFRVRAPPVRVCLDRVLEDFLGRVVHVQRLPDVDLLRQSP
eukprot:7372029-Heterocapsa_arctica.AAC.1